jgi:hypothetical protein
MGNDRPDVLSDPTDRCFSVRSLAKFWRVSPTRIRDLARRRILNGFVVGRAMRFSPEAVREAEERLSAPAGRVRRQRRDDTISPSVRAMLGLDSK